MNLVLKFSSQLSPKSWQLIFERSQWVDYVTIWYVKHIWAHYVIYMYVNNIFVSVDLMCHKCDSIDILLVSKPALFNEFSQKRNAALLLLIVNKIAWLC